MAMNNVYNFKIEKTYQYIYDKIYNFTYYLINVK